MDAISRRYSVDPLTVAEWSPVRLAFALRCATAGNAAEERAQAEAAARRGPHG